MGTVMFSADGKVSSALDNNDGSPVCFGLYYCASAYNGTTYNDGDEVSGNSIGYSSPSFSGFQVHLTHGLAGSYDNSAHGGSATEPVNSVDSIAVTGSIMGATVKAAVASIDYDQIGWNQPGGSTSTGQSTSELDTSEAATDNGLKQIGISVDPDNSDTSAANCNAYCVFNVGEHVFKVDTALA